MTLLGRCRGRLSQRVLPVIGFDDTTRPRQSIGASCQVWVAEIIAVSVPVPSHCMICLDRVTKVF